MKYYATIGVMQVMTKKGTCGLFPKSMHSITADEAMDFFNTYQSPGNLVFLYDDAKDAKIAAAHLAASRCDSVLNDNKYRKDKVYTAPIFEVEVPDHVVLSPQNSNIQFKTALEKKVAAHFGVKDLDAAKSMKNYPCDKSFIRNVFSVTILHPYFHKKRVEIAPDVNQLRMKAEFDAMVNSHYRRP